MDLTQLVAQLTDAKVDLAAKTADITSLQAQLTTANARVVELETQVAEAGDPAVALAEKDAEIATEKAAKDSAQADLGAAVEALQGIAKKVLAAAGKVNVEVASTVADLQAQIAETTDALAAALVAGGRSNDATTDATQPAASLGLGGFRVRK